MRFDETTLQGHFGHTSRSSSEFFPVRTGSGLGSLPMVERSSSHKSDGRQSSTGHSAHSTRLNSLAFDTRSPAPENQVSAGPPPGLFLLGPLPCIMRCWLDNKFSNDALLYAAVCTGSYTSMISSRLARRYGMIKQPAERGRGRVNLQVFLPEATVQQASSRPLNLIPQVPSLSIEFEVFELPDDVETLQVIIGSDVLRSKSAELSFSQDRMIIYDDERNKLAVPLVRPENTSVFQDLRTAPVALFYLTPDDRAQRTAAASTRVAHVTKTAKDESQQRTEPNSILQPEGRNKAQESRNSPASKNTNPLAIVTAEQSIPNPPEGLVTAGSGAQRRPEDALNREPLNGVGSSTPTKESQAGMWGSWRRDSNQPPSSDSTFSSIASSSNYQRPGRGKGMKVLKPARSGTSRSVSSTQNTSGIEQTPSKWQDPAPRSAGLNVAESPETRTPDSPRRSFSSEPRASFSSLGGKPRTANPVGGASAFGWLNSGQK